MKANYHKDNDHEKYQDYKIKKFEEKHNVSPKKHEMAKKMSHPKGYWRKGIQNYDTGKMNKKVESK